MFAEQPVRMSDAEFLAWEARQTEKHELIDGLPVPRRTRLMAGGTWRHAVLGSRVVAALSRRLEGRPCEAVGSDLKVRSATGSFRYPDAMVECGAADLLSLFASEPRVIVEVLSPSNTPHDQMRLLADYQAISTLHHLIFLRQDAPGGFVWNRTADGWVPFEFAGWDAVLDLTAIAVSLPIGELYRGLVDASTESG